MLVILASIPNGSGTMCVVFSSLSEQEGRTNVSNAEIKPFRGCSDRPEAARTTTEY